MGLRSCPLIMQTLIHVYTYVNAGYLYLYKSIQDLRVYVNMLAMCIGLFMHTWKP